MIHTHKPTDLPTSNPVSDRCVYHDGKLIGRLVQIEQGPKQRQWSWAGQWMGLDHSGIVDTLEAALEAIKTRHKALTPDQRKSLSLLKNHQQSEFPMQAALPPNRK